MTDRCKTGRGATWWVAFVATIAARFGGQAWACVGGGGSYRSNWPYRCRRCSSGSGLALLQPRADLLRLLLDAAAGLLAEAGLLGQPFDGGSVATQ